MWGSGLLRARTWLSALGTLVLLLVFSAIGALVHVDTAVGRRIAEHRAAVLLTDTFVGSVSVTDVRHLGPEGFAVGRLELRDAEGRVVLELVDVSVGLDVVEMIRRIVSGGERFTIVVDHVRAEKASVLVTPDESGHPSIESALTPRAASPTAAPSKPGAGPDIRVYLPTIEIGQADGSVDIANVPPFSGRVVGVRGRVLVAPQGVAVDVARFGAALRYRDGTEARGTGTLSIRAPGPIQGSFEGFLGDVEVQARVAVTDERLHVVATLPGARPRAIRQFLPDWPLRDRVAGTVEVQGTLEELTVDAQLTAGRATIAAKGTAAPTNPPRADLTFQGSHLDLQSLFPTAPETDLELDGRLQVESRDGRVTLSIGAKSAATTIAEQSVPAAEFEGKLTGGHFAGTATLHEPGLPLTAQVDISPEGVVELDVRASSFDLSKIERVKLPFDARGSARVIARIDQGAITGSYDLRLRDVRRGSFEAGTLDSRGSAKGDVAELESLAVNGTAQGTSVRIGSFSFDNASGSYSGAWPNARFDLDVGSGDHLKATARAHLHFGRTVALRDVELVFRDGHVRGSGRASYIDPEAGALDVEQFHVEGIGGPVEGSLRLRPKLVETHVTGQGVDIERLTRLLGISQSTVSGRMRVDADVVIGRDVTRARVNLGVGNATISGVSGLSFQLSSTLEGRRLEAEGSGILENVGTFGTRASGTLGGSPMELASWRGATGEGELTLSDLNLPLLSLLLGKDAPVRRVEGRAYARVTAKRDTPNQLPDLSVTATTRGLALTLRPEGKEPATVIEGIDVHTTTSIAGRTGDTSGTLLLTDDRGDLLSAGGVVQIDYPAIIDAPARWLSVVKQAPLELRLRLPERRLADLPPIARPESLAGRVEGSLVVRGSVDSPSLQLLGSVRNLVAAESTTAVPLDVDVDARLDPTRGQMDLGARASVGGRTVARVAGHAKREGTLWQGRTELDLDGLPIEAVPPLATSELHGNLHGHAMLMRTGHTRQLALDLDWREGAIGRTPIDDGKLSVATHPDGTKVAVQLATAGGRLSAQTHLPIDWSSPVPTLRANTPIDVTLTARRFDAGALGPIVGDSFRRLGGFIDADAKMRALRTDETDGWQTTFAGRATLRRGEVLIQPLGMDIRQASFDVSARAQGDRTFIDIHDISAQVRSDTPNLVGDATIELRGFSAVGATTALEIKGLPLLFEGVSQGRATGKLKGKVSRQEDSMLLEVDIPEMVVQLPRRASRDVIDLADHRDVIIVQRIPEEASSSVTPWQIVLNLGDAVRVKQTEIDLGIRGTPIIEIGRDTNVYGSIQLTAGGRATVMGHVFSIESGTLFFDTGKPDDPRLDITATWRAPTDTVVTVDINGTFNAPIIRFTSDPPMPEPEIFSLLLGGPSADTGAQTDTTSSGERGLGSGVAAIGNEILGDSPVELRVGTTEQSRARYTAAVRVGQNLWFEASTYERTNAGAGDSSVFSGTIDYRFTRNWSLRTEVGTAGGIVDLLWQYRY